jgi:hypothetical protein
VGANAELKRLRTAITGELEIILQAQADALRARQLEYLLQGWRGLFPPTAESESRVSQRRERLGWKFARIRGSVFFRDPDRAMAEVFRRIEELGIPPESATGSSAAAQPPDEIRQRIIRRAQELRKQWAEQGQQAK